MMLISGRFHWKTVLPDGVVIGYGTVPNGIITASIDDLFDTHFSAGSPAAGWYLGLISSTNFTALASTDSMAQNGGTNGWQEATNYSEVARQPWSPGNSSGGVKTNATAAEFTIDTEEGLAGMFLTSDDTLDGTAGILWATGQFAATNTPPVGATFKLLYELQGREG